MATKKTTTPVKNASVSSREDFAFGKENYILMLAGIAVIILGFVLMAGGGSEDPNVFDPSIFSARRIIVAPVVVLIGFIIEVYAIVKKSKE
jgi:uncharacterized membrane protein